MLKRNILVLLLLGVFFQLPAQFIKTFSNIDYSHDHYSVESIDDGLVMAGTIYPDGNLTSTDIHIQRLDMSGNLVWETQHDIGTDERCLDISLQGTDIILLTGSDIESGKHRIFIMQLDINSGNLIDLVYLYPGALAPPYTDQFSTEIIYSESQDLYFITGWADINAQEDYPSGARDQIGLLICLDGNFTHVWGKTFRPNNTNNHSIAALHSIVEIPNVGVAVSGTIHEGAALCYDYSGNLLWDVSHNVIKNGGGRNIVMSKGIEYNSATDKIYFSYFDARATYLAEVSNASLATASVTTLADYGDLMETHGIPFHPIDIDINNDLGIINLMGVSSESSLSLANYASKSLHSTFISIDLSNLQANSVNVLESNNRGLLVNDHDYYAFSHPTIVSTFSDEFAKWNDGYAVLRYEYSSTVNGNDFYDLTLTETNSIGRTEFDCETQYEIATQYPQPVATNPPYITERGYDHLHFLSEEYSIQHSNTMGCFEQLPCDININSLTRVSNLDCYEYLHEVNVTAGAGTFIYEYFWNWGDGSTSTTTTPSASHLFPTSSCSFYICVTVKAYGSDGTQCQQTLCNTFLSVNETGCPACGSPRMKSETIGEEGKNQVSIAPNPASNQVNFLGFEESTVVIITDMGGKEVLNKQLNSNNQLDISQLETGIYLVRANDNNGNSLIEKLFIK